MGNDQSIQLESPSTDSTCAIIFTSATSGTPKPVRLTHKMMLGAAVHFQTDIKISERDTFISLLNHCHIVETSLQFAFIAFGIKIAYPPDSVENLVEEIGFC